MIKILYVVMTIVQIIAAIGVGYILFTPVFISLLRFAGYNKDEIKWLLLNADRVKLVDAGTRIVKKSKKVFGSMGDIVLKVYCVRHLKKACKAIEIEYRPPHQMRKTYASILLSSGVDEAIVKKEMRHTDIATTRAYYQFITESSSEEKAIIDKVMGL